MGKKKKAEAAPLSKKERKAAEKRAAAIEAEIDRREKKAAKKALKRSDESNAKAAKKAKKKAAEKKAPKHETAADPVALADALDIHEEHGSKPTDEEIIAKADEVLADSNLVEEVREKATRVRAEAIARQDAAMKERIKAKGDRAERLRAMQAEAETIGQPGKIKAKKKEKAEAPDPVLADIAEQIAEVAQQVEAVETEAGREFVAGPASKDPAFFTPEDAPVQLESGRNGYKIIQLGSDGKPDPRKVRQMTRITTFVKNIDDETSLKKWEKRLVVEGLAADATAPESAGLVPKINELAHRRDVKVAKAIKADRKGKLGVGEVGAIIAAAEKEAKDAIDAIVEEAAMLAGRNDKANSGSHLHTLAEIRDSEGIDAVRQLHESGELVAHDNDGTNDGLEPMPVTATDLASIEAYDVRMNRLGAKVLHAEAVVVNDELGNAGRLDRIITAKLPELVIGRGTPEEYVRPADTRARRYVADIKSGSLEYGAGQISRQLAAYALADLYDLETGERTSHRAARDVALVFHLPLGEGTCSVYAVDLKAGTRLLKLSAEVRRARNTGKKTIDLSVDIADPAPDTAAE